MKDLEKELKKYKKALRLVINDYLNDVTSLKGDGLKDVALAWEREYLEDKRK